MEVFFESLAKTKSKKNAFEALKKHLVKRRLQTTEIREFQGTEDSLMKEFEEVWMLIQKKRILEKLLGK